MLLKIYSPHTMSISFISIPMRKMQQQITDMDKMFTTEENIIFALRVRILPTLPRVVPEYRVITYFEEVVDSKYYVIKIKLNYNL